MGEPRLPFMAIDPNMRGKRKFRRLMARLPGEKPRDVLGSLACFWSAVFLESPEGDVSAWSNEEITFAAEWHGDGRFVAALRAEGWIDTDGRVHDWFEWGGYLYRERKAAADRKAAERERKRAEEKQRQQDARQKSARPGEPVTGQSQDVTATSHTTNQPTNETNETNETGERGEHRAPAGGGPTSAPTEEAGKTPSRRKAREMTPSGKAPVMQPVRDNPPTLEEIREEIAARGLHVDAQRFLDRNTATGWSYGRARVPMVDWRAALRTWETNGFGNGTNGSSGGASAKPAPLPPGSKYGGTKVRNDG